MLVVKDHLLNVPIMSLQTGAAVAQTASFIVDPRELKAVGFYCSGTRLDVNPAILTVADIREIGGLGIIVDSADVISSPDDLVRLKEVIDFKFVLDNKSVVDESGKKLGFVVNFTLDSKSLYVIKLHVRPGGVWQAFKTTELMIDRSQVLHVTDAEVVVKKTTIKEEKPVEHATPILENPFRRAQAESTTTRSNQE